MYHLDILILMQTLLARQRLRRLVVDSQPSNKRQQLLQTIRVLIKVLAMIRLI
jgi:hypothetical protein